MPNTNPSDLDREALKAAIDAYENAWEYFGNSNGQLEAGVRAYLSALPRASGVPEAERRPDAYQQLKDGKWVECSEFVARGWGDKLDEGTRALYASPPPVAAPSGEANETWLSGARNGYERGYWDAQHGVPCPIASEPKDGESVEWRPIATAPKDGREMLGFMYNYGTPSHTFIDIIRYHTSKFFWSCQDYGEPTATWGMPTHWMPLPDAPITRTAPSGAKP